VASKIEKWQQEYPDDSFFFRPYADKIVTTNQEPSSDGLEDEDKDDADVRVVTAESKQTMMFAHQTAWQKRLLRKYGNDICLLDATYRTTRYSLPLFFLAVKTNVDFQVIASFIIQHESTDAIKEALQLIKDWNPEWHPKFFMTDYCRKRKLMLLKKSLLVIYNLVCENCIAQIKCYYEFGHYYLHTIIAFSETTVYLCDFHREQAWERWVSKGENGVAANKGEVLSHLRKITWAPSEEKFKEAVLELKSNNLWKKNSRLRNWFENTWLKQQKVQCMTSTISIIKVL
jgi:hypothetical protein